MSYGQPLPPDAKATEAAFTLGSFIREEYGKSGLRFYLSMLDELFPHAWTEQIAERLDMPSPLPAQRPPFTEQSMPPPEPRQQKSDMEKVLRLMQVMGNMRN